MTVSSGASGSPPISRFFRFASLITAIMMSPRAMNSEVTRVNSSESFLCQGELGGALFIVIVYRPPRRTEL